MGSRTLDQYLPPPEALAAEKKVEIEARVARLRRSAEIVAQTAASEAIVAAGLERAAQTAQSGDRAALPQEFAAALDRCDAASAREKWIGWVPFLEKKLIRDTAVARKTAQTLYGTAARQAVVGGNGALAAFQMGVRDVRWQPIDDVDVVGCVSRLDALAIEFGQAVGSAQNCLRLEAELKRRGLPVEPMVSDGHVAMLRNEALRVVGDPRTAARSWAVERVDHEILSVTCPPAMGEDQLVSRSAGMTSEGLEAAESLADRVHSLYPETDRLANRLVADERPDAAWRAMEASAGHVLVHAATGAGMQAILANGALLSVKEAYAENGRALRTTGVSGASTQAGTREYDPDGGVGAAVEAHQICFQRDSVYKGLVPAERRNGPYPYRFAVMISESALMERGYLMSVSDHDGYHVFSPEYRGAPEDSGAQVGLTEMPLRFVCRQEDRSELMAMIEATSPWSKDLAALSSEQRRSWHERMIVSSEVRGDESLTAIASSSAAEVVWESGPSARGYFIPVATATHKAGTSMLLGRLETTGFEPEPAGLAPRAAVFAGKAATEMGKVLQGLRQLSPRRLALHAESTAAAMRQASGEERMGFARGLHLVGQALGDGPAAHWKGVASAELGAAAEPSEREVSVRSGEER